MFRRGYFQRGAAALEIAGKYVEIGLGWTSYHAIAM
jgi:hypothetical protein